MNPRARCIFCGKKPKLGTIYWKPAKEKDEKRVICGECKDAFICLNTTKEVASK